MSEYNLRLSDLELNKLYVMKGCMYAPVCIDSMTIAPRYKKYIKHICDGNKTMKLRVSEEKSRFREYKEEKHIIASSSRLIKESVMCGGYETGSLTVVASDSGLSDEFLNIDLSNALNNGHKLVNVFIEDDNSIYITKQSKDSVEIIDGMYLSVYTLLEKLTNLKKEFDYDLVIVNPTNMSRHDLSVWNDFSILENCAVILTSSLIDYKRCNDCYSDLAIKITEDEGCSTKGLLSLTRVRRGDTGSVEISINPTTGDIDEKPFEYKAEVVDYYYDSNLLAIVFRGYNTPKVGDVVFNPNSKFKTPWVISEIEKREGKIYASDKRRSEKALIDELVVLARENKPVIYVVASD